MEKNKLSSISKASTYEKMGEFWDSHDFTEFDDERTVDVRFEISCKISVEPDLLSSIEKHARLRKIDTETLVNLWLHEKLSQVNADMRPLG
ncbi:conserved hypothetical protein [Candidatus Desulfarcum epimagneticum]|uniref:Uncharacterized protein n=1 Tax=uncultured Desulfobacteraceae bacterium TaxID=218296 RepID=A0A484HJV5_9BACT|nr:conserved hypothetical protein [uncultured Desulfobacteraceae bacterium]